MGHYYGFHPSEIGEVTFHYTVVGIPVGTDVQEPAPGPDTSTISWVVTSPSSADSDPRIELALQKETYVGLEVYDIGGRRVRLVCDATLPAGVHGLVWDRHDDSGNPLCAGVYFARLSLDSQVHGRRVVVVR